MAGYIPDGYTANGYVAEERNGESVLWSACHFKFRPAPAHEVDELNLLAPLKEMEAKRRKFLVSHIVEWDFRHEGSVLPINEDVMGRLYKGFRDVFFGIICGTRHSDDDPALKIQTKPPTQEESAKN